MLKKFDNFCDSIITEGRKADKDKPFTINVDKVKQHISEIDKKHHLHIHDKGHFGAIADELSGSHVYTPKDFMKHVKLIMMDKGKGQIADGYARMFYEFLKNRADSPFNEYEKPKKVEPEPVQQEPTETSELTDDLSPEY